MKIRSKMCPFVLFFRNEFRLVRRVGSDDGLKRKEALFLVQHEFFLSASAIGFAVRVCSFDDRTGFSRTIKQVAKMSGLVRILDWP